MKIKIFHKIFLGFLIIIFILAIIIPGIFFNNIKTYYLHFISEQLLKTAISIKYSVIENFDTSNHNILQKYIKTLGEEIDTRITVIDSNGIVYADSKHNPLKMENHKNRPEIQDALNNKIGHSIRYSKTIGKDMLYIAIPLKKENTIIGVLRVSLFVEQINDFINTLRLKILYIVLILIFLSLLIAFISSKALSKSLKKLSEATHQIAKGDFDVHIDISSNDEIEELSQNFNLMIEKINTLFKQLDMQKNELNELINFIPEPLLLINKNGKIIKTNTAFKQFVKQENPDNKLYWQVLSKYSSLTKDIIPKTIESKKNIKKEIIINNKYLIVSTTHINKSEKFVIMFYDITEIKQVEEMKKSLIANVSHELRTPLTAISGYLETMEEYADKNTSEYISIMKKHTERLNNIVKDLLLLSHIEEKNELEIKNVHINLLIKNILKIFDKKIKEKGLSLILQLDKDLDIVQIDEFKMEQVMINLIDNAIKYTLKGNIEIITEKNEPFFKIIVKDTGIGIKKEHIPKIFNRFYVVNKSRSRKSGGTGLGLSIVKHIVMLHKGNININSEYGKGTSISIILPINN